jgi:hypothetical protein
MTAKARPKKKMGRPPGSKTRPAALRGLLWAAAHLGEGTEPPFAAARHWQEVAKSEPGLFVQALNALGKGGSGRDTKGSKCDSTPGPQPGAAEPKPQSVPLEGTIWLGSEDSVGNTSLRFEFKPDESVQIITCIDGRNLCAQGAWRCNGECVTIVRSPWRYEGVIKRNTICGCVFNLDDKLSEPWNFKLRRL